MEDIQATFEFDRCVWFPEISKIKGLAFPTLHIFCLLSWQSFKLRTFYAKTEQTYNHLDQTF